MKTAVKSPESAVYRRGLGIFLAETPLTEAPKHLFRPLSPGERWSELKSLQNLSFDPSR
jgi:hypothetical protein